MGITGKPAAGFPVIVLRTRKILASALYDTMKQTCSRTPPYSILNSVMHRQAGECARGMRSRQLSVAHTPTHNNAHTFSYSSARA